MRRLQLSLPGFEASLEISRETSGAKHRRILSQFRETNVYFDGPYPSWADATALAAGYDAPQILNNAVEAALKVSRGEAAYERDTVTFIEPQFGHELMAWLLFVASRSGGSLRVLDFGGALGSSYFQHRAVLGHLPDLKWCVVEQAKFVEAGKRHFADETLSFSAGVDEAVEKIRPNVLLLSGVLQYLDDPHSFLKQVLAKGIEYILIDRTMAQDEVAEAPYVQHVPEWIYRASYPLWFLDANRIERALQDDGYMVMERFQPQGGFGTQLPAHLGLEHGQELRGNGPKPVGPWPYRGWFASKGGDL